MSTLLRLIGGFAALTIAAAVADSSFAQTARPTVAAAQTDGQPAAGSPTPAPAVAPSPWRPAKSRAPVAPQHPERSRVGPGLRL